MFHIAQALLKAGQPVILENVFHPELASPKLRELAHATRAATLQIICWADPQVLFERFKQRQRHPGHVDAQSLDEFRASLAREQPLRLEIEGPVIEVDTTDFASLNYNSILGQIRAGMDGIA